MAIAFHSVDFVVRPQLGLRPEALDRCGQLET
jgi:hypothetical protein